MSLHIRTPLRAAATLSETSPEDIAAGYVDASVREAIGSVVHAIRESSNAAEWAAYDASPSLPSYATLTPTSSTLSAGWQSPTLSPSIASQDTIDILAATSTISSASSFMIHVRIFDCRVTSARKVNWKSAACLLQIRPSILVQDFRIQLQLQEGYPADEQRLFYQGQEIDPAARLKMLTSAPIPGISVLMRYDRKASLLKFQDPMFQFKVHFISCEPQYFQANGSETVFEVAQRIFLAEGVPTISLRLLHGEDTIWDGPVYESGDHDNPTLRQIGIKQNSVIRADVVFKDINSQFCLPNNGSGDYGLDCSAGMMRMPSGSRPKPDLARTGMHVSFKSAPKFVEDRCDGYEGYIA